MQCHHDLLLNRPGNCVSSSALTSACWDTVRKEAQERCKNLTAAPVKSLLGAKPNVLVIVGALEAFLPSRLRAATRQMPQPDRRVLFLAPLPHDLCKGNGENKASKDKIGARYQSCI